MCVFIECIGFQMPYFETYILWHIGVILCKHYLRKILIYFMILNANVPYQSMQDWCQKIFPFDICDCVCRLESYFFCNNLIDWGKNQGRDRERERERERVCEWVSENLVRYVCNSNWNSDICIQEWFYVNQWLPNCWAKRISRVVPKTKYHPSTIYQERASC